MSKPKRIRCAITGNLEDVEKHVQTFCRFYAGQAYKPSLGNEACHASCTVPKRYEVPGLVKSDDHD